MDDLNDAGINVVGISYDSIAQIEEFAEEKKLTFPLLSDSESTVIKAFGILNKDAKGKQAGIPHPRTFVINSDLEIVASLDGTVRDRHTVDKLIEALSDDDKL